MPSPAEPINYSLWLLRVVSWDGILPLVVTSVSAVAALLFQNNALVGTVLLITVPMLAFFARLIIGRKHIRDNFCGRIVKRVQLIALVLALFIFVLGDFLIVLWGLIPKNQRQVPAEEISVYVIALSIYLFLVIVAMYPGRERIHRGKPTRLNAL